MCEAFHIALVCIISGGIWCNFFLHFFVPVFLSCIVRALLLAIRGNVRCVCASQPSSADIMVADITSLSVLIIVIYYAYFRIIHLQNGDDDAADANGHISQATILHFIFFSCIQMSLLHKPSNRLFLSYISYSVVLTDLLEWTIFLLLTFVYFQRKNIQCQRIIDERWNENEN